MTSRTKRRALALATGLVIGGVAVVAWRQHQRAGVIAAALPDAPDVTDWPAPFREHLAAASAAARSGKRNGIVQLARLYHANGFFTPAQTCYEILQHLEPREPLWWHAHAALLAGFGATDRALRSAEHAVQLAPDYVPARLRLAEILLKRAEPGRAAAEFQAVLQKLEHPHALLGLARIDIEALRWSEARTKLERVISLTNHDLGYDLIVTVYEQLGLAAEATQVRSRAKASGAYRDPADPWLDELIADCFDAYRLSLAAGTAQRSGDQKQSVALLERAVAFAPDDVGIRFQYAQTLAQQRDFARARAELERCTKLQPTFPDAWAHLATLVEQQGDAPAAERIVAAGLAHCPDSPGLHLMRARFHRRAGRIVPAIDAYRRSVQLRANEADPHVELATLLLQTNAAAEAQRSLHAALAAEPDHPTALSLLTLTAITARDETSARTWLTRIAAQPRIPGTQRQQLLDAFRGQFGRDFRP